MNFQTRTINVLITSIRPGLKTNPILIIGMKIETILIIRITTTAAI